MQKSWKRHRKKYSLPFVQLHHFMIQCPAWKALSASAVKVYIALASHYNGNNNGKIGFSVRMGVTECSLSSETVRKALVELQEHGFIICTQKGGFDYKLRHASLWRLTAFPCHATNTPITKDFVRWESAKDSNNGLNFSVARPQNSSPEAA